MNAQRGATLLVVGVITAGAAWMDKPAPASPRTCGVALGLFASDPDFDYGPMLDEIADHGATDVMLSAPWVQGDVTSSALAPKPGHSPSTTTLTRTIRQARAHGMGVSLMPVVRLEHTAPGRWRGTLRPESRAAWFAQYSALMMDHAELAQREGATRLVLGSELASLESDDARWRQMATDVRARFSGTLTWSANWDRFESVPFWDAMDEVGVSAWFELGPDAEAGWDEPQARLQAIAEHTHKPVLLTEVGYPARNSAALRPWDHTGAPPVRLHVQAQLYDTFFRRFTDQSIVGAFIWNWFGHGGAHDAGYSPRGRPAATVLKQHFRRWCGA